MPRFQTSRLLLAAAALSTLAASGCYREGGNLWSNDTHVYVSTSWQPKTISLVDTRTEEIVWSIDVPVGQQLVVSFEKGDGKGDVTPDAMEYGVMDAGELSGGLTDAVDVPGRGDRRLDMTLRAAPEMPGLASKDRKNRPAETTPSRPTRQPNQPAPRQPSMEVGG